MAYIVTAGDQEFKIEAKRIEVRPHDEVFRVDIDGEKKKVNIARISSTHLSILVDDQSYDVEVGRFEDDYQVVIRGEVFCFKVVDERQAFAASVHHDTGEVVINAPMPGLVIDVLINEDDEVRGKEKLLILEAMKMQNEIRAPRGGRVAELKVKSGDSVNTGDRLIVIR